MKRFNRRIAAAAAAFSVTLNVGCSVYGPPTDDGESTDISFGMTEEVTSEESGEVDSTTESDEN